MTEVERATIIKFAQGDKTLREQAIAIYRDTLRKYGEWNDPLLNFMSEVDNPVPDLGLRARYRQRVKAMRLPKLL
jgi:hypothetical protein